MSMVDTSVMVERNVWIAMRDGVRLQADVWRPTGAGRFPALLQRTPYNRGDSFAVVVNAGIEPLRAVEQGFVVVVQDTRGRFGSEGSFDPFVHEALDGYDTIEWLAAQPYCDGNVGMYGASYYGATQLLAASARPPALKAIAPKATASDYHDHWTYQGGALQLGFAMYWALGLAGTELDRREAAGEELGAIRAQLRVLLADPWSAFGRRPLADIAPLDELLPAWRDWLDHPTRDDFWQTISVTQQQELDVPALHIGGWFDLFLRGTLATYEEMSRGPNCQQRLIVGPWAHAVEYDALGEVEFGDLAGAAALDMTRVHLDWFSQILKSDAGAADAAPVRVFVMAANVWRDEAQWPPARAAATSMYLAGDRTEDGFVGSLQHQPPLLGAESVTFSFDPADPVPTVGGATFLPGAYVGLHAGPRDQRGVEGRSDVLCYESEAFTADLEIAGPVALVLHACTSAADTDWTAKLVDVHPDGRALNICDGIVRARYRQGTGSPIPVEPDQPFEYRIDLGATCIVIFAGHALRLEVSSSNFPRFDVNPNHGGDIATAEKNDLVIAQQTVLHSGAYPSRLELFVIPGPEPG
ncbi:MAG: peptidase [Acidimicrobiaceae bacterium]|nr:peptidase [Acidimicrobiaceae bacterium]